MMGPVDVLLAIQRQLRVAPPVVAVLMGNAAARTHAAVDLPASANRVLESPLPRCTAKLNNSNSVEIQGLYKVKVYVCERVPIHSPYIVPCFIYVQEERSSVVDIHSPLEGSDLRFLSCKSFQKGFTIE